MADPRHYPTDEPQSPSRNWDPTSYAVQEGIGQVPSFLRLGPLRLHAGQGVPAATIGANGDFYFRSDGAAGANTTIYFKAAGTWTGLTA